MNKPKLDVDHAVRSVTVLARLATKSYTRIKFMSVNFQTFHSL